MEIENTIKMRDKMYKSQNCIVKMEMASLARYCFILYACNREGIDKLLYFFTPCEEFDGGSIFSNLSADYKII